MSKLKTKRNIKKKKDKSVELVDLKKKINKANKSNVNSKTPQVGLVKANDDHVNFPEVIKSSYYDTKVKTGYIECFNKPIDIESTSEFPELLTDK